MSRRFWAFLMIVSLLTALGGGAFLYKTLVDRSGVVITELSPTDPIVNGDVIQERAAVPEEKPVVSEPVRTKRNIQFVYINSTAKDVFIIGNFEGKKSSIKKPMEKNRNKWTITLKLDPGTYEYAYLVNGRSVRDPYNKKTANGKSVITVKPLPSN